MHLSNHLGNVLVTISDRKLVEEDEGVIALKYEADVLFASDYYPFGMQMPGREFSQEEYRYGFQGQETDKEWLGGAVSYKYRVHDARIGRFLSVDPLAPDYPWNSPYAFSENRVIDGVELEGLEYINYFDARIATNNLGRAVILVHTMSDNYQEAWDNHLKNMGYPTSAMSTDEYLASREAQKFQVIPKELLVSPNIANGGMVRFINQNWRENHRYAKTTGKLDRRFNSTKRINSNVPVGKGLLVIAVIQLGKEAYDGYNAMFDIIAFEEDNKVLKFQFEAFFDTIEAINGYVKINEVDASLMEGENLVNLINYVFKGEIAGNNEQVQELGDRILDSNQKNGGTKFRKPEGQDENK
jgi:RHS repeat-associated protein